MKAIVYLGDEAVATGFRLAGIDARVAGDDAAAAFAQARAEAAVLLVGARLAARLPAAMLAAARLAAEPPLLVVDLDGAAAEGGVALEVRRLLGGAR